MVRAETPLSPQSLQEWLWITPVLVALSGFAGGDFVECQHHTGASPWLAGQGRRQTETGASY